MTHRHNLSCAHQVARNGFLTLITLPLRHFCSVSWHLLVSGIDDKKLDYCSLRKHVNRLYILCTVVAVVDDDNGLAFMIMVVMKI